MKITYSIYDPAGGTAKQLLVTDSIRTFVTSRFLLSTSTANKTTLSVYLVAPSAAPNPTNALLLNYQLAGNSFLEGQGGFVVPAGGWAIWVSCDTGNGAVFTVSGDLIVNTE